MAKKKSGKKGRIPWMKGIVISLALLVVAFFTLLQLVRGGAFGELPTEEELSSIQHEQATLVLAEDGSLIGKLFAEDRTNVRYEDLPRHLIDALVSTEDARFFTHQGVDGRSYIRVFFRTLLGGDRSGGGGSTISQQIIKNLYGRKPHGLLTVPVNKMKEALVAQRLERTLTKNDVLVLYFNSVPFGENTYGVEAAAQRFFGKPARRLRVEEGAVLVGMLKANTTYNPRLHPDKAKGRRDQVMQLMRTRGHFTDEELDSLKKMPLTLRYTGGDALELNGYFVAQVAKEARALLDEVAKKTGGTYDLEKDGLRVYTTLDPILQGAANDAVHQQLATMQPKLDRELRARKARTAWEKKLGRNSGTRWKKNAERICEIYAHTGKRVDTLSYRDSLWHYHRLLNGAVLMMDPASGAVRAWVGGNDHQYLPYDLVQAKRPVASTIKPFVYAAAVERGFEPCDYLNNEKQVYTDFEDWAPDNFDRDTVGGEVALWYALAKSMNRPTVDLFFRTGQDTLRRTFQALGLPVKDIDKPATALGATDVALVDLVAAYGAFAMRGQRVTPQLINRITDAQGKVLYKAKQVKPQQAITVRTAATITAMLRRAVDQGTGAALRSRHGIASQLAGKTGTSQDYGDAWFVAYTPGLVIGTWVGAFDNDVHFNSALGSGSQLALPIAGKVLKVIEGKRELKRRYLLPFDAMADEEIDMDCDPRHTPSALERLLDGVFRPRQGNDLDTSRKREPNFFDRLFKKKD